MSGQAFDLLYEKNAIMVKCKSFHKDEEFMTNHSIKVTKNKEDNVTLDLDYMTSKAFLLNNFKS